jgi:hypothetical protein
MEGLLWFDGDPNRPLAVKIAEATDRYTQRFGVAPNLCLVHPDQLPAASQKGTRTAEMPADIRIKASKTVLLHHLLVGVAASPEGTE